MSVSTWRLVEQAAGGTGQAQCPAARVAHGFHGVCCLSPSGDRSVLPVDIYDAGDALFVVPSAPGSLSEDVRVETAGAIVTITVTQRPYARPAGCEVARRERYAAPLKREIELPFAVEARDIAQTIDRGVVTLRIAKPA